MIPVNTPLLDGNEKKYLLECIESGWISSEGPFVARFEVEFAKVVERRYGIACANGSGALDIAVAAAEIGPGDEVIMPAFTIISPAASVVRAGAIPVLVDSDPVTWNMDVSQIEACITTRTKAILVVHIYGLPVDMDPLLEIARRHGLIVIEDAAEMHGQTYRGHPCGSFGDLSTFSFYPNKHITTGEGGMVVANDERLAERCRSFRNLCFQPGRRFVHEELGWNYRMTNMQAALGLAQLERLSEFVLRKRNMGELYEGFLKGTPGLRLPLTSTAYAENIFWVYGLILEDDVPLDAEAVMKSLGQLGIGTRPFFWPLHQQPVFQNQGLFNDIAMPVAETMATRGFYLPSGLGLQAPEIQQCAKVLKEILSAIQP
ncbi:MAG: DegT/DnrJ/EryC1/StrS family aminotransferase [Planctomycetaceae bacterium]|nr:DegT/DnrJ/EryC1/StrS family aminotransferase [Planctomycetaceae bacterium]